MAKKNWIGKLKKGTLTAQARCAGMSVAAFCAQPKSKLSPLARKRCAARKTLMKLSKRR